MTEDLPDFLTPEDLATLLPVSPKTNRPPVPTMLDALPADIREELTSLAEAGRGLFGRKQTQQIVDGHLDLILRLRREYAATHADLAAVLQAVGITARDGEALTAATLSSAI